MGSSNIKGITVEIGGDTGPLNEALKGVNKTSKDLQSELTQINKLLKLDPTNVTLLTQKQNVLNEAIANASKKLQDLKEAEVQVQAQFNKGEVTEEQYRALQREIEGTTIKLHGYESQLKDINNTSNTTATNTQKMGTEAEGTKGKFSAFAVAAGTALGNLLANGVQKLISGIEELGRKMVEQITGLAEYAR